MVAGGLNSTGNWTGLGTAAASLEVAVMVLSYGLSIARSGSGKRNCSPVAPLASVDFGQVAGFTSLCASARKTGSNLMCALVFLSWLLRFHRDSFCAPEGRYRVFYGPSIIAGFGENAACFHTCSNPS